MTLTDASSQQKATSKAEARDEDTIKLICPSEAVLLRETRDEMKRLANTTEGRTMLRNAKAGTLPPLRILSPEAYDYGSILDVQAPEILAWIVDYKSKSSSPSKQMFERTEFLCGMADYYDAKATPTWLVMACAIHIDM